MFLCTLAFGFLWYLNGDFQGALKQAERSVKIGQQSIDQSLNRAILVCNGASESLLFVQSRHGYSYERIVHTAEHELGHAIGLDHTDEKSVMQPAGSFYGIQEEDVANLRKIYETSE